MLNVIDANPVGRYRVEDASPTDGVVAGTPGSVVAGTTTGAVALAGVVALTPGMDAHAVGRYRAEDAHPIDGAVVATDGDGEVGGELTCGKTRRANIANLPELLGRHQARGVR